jgi:16S rRNA (cytosine1402-N4)-methyltransferase
LDGTLGAGGYTRALLEAGADHVTGVDRDPSVFELARTWSTAFEGRISFIEGVFSALDSYAEQLDGIVLDLGVSSMQLDQADRGFSFIKDGPLDMRMSSEGPSAADLVNTLEDVALAEILYIFGEERASRRISKAIVKRREQTPFSRTLDLAAVIEGCLPRAKPGQSHPATRSFQALRIAVNNEYRELADGLEASERALAEGGQLAVVTFHSIEDRMVKRFLQSRAGKQQSVSRYAPEAEAFAPRFEIVTRKAVGPSDKELAANPRARSAKLRVARRTAAPAGQMDRKTLGMPTLKAERA